jgi:hypothetical protein
MFVYADFTSYNYSFCQCDFVALTHCNDAHLVYSQTIAIGAPISRFLVSPTDPKMAFVVTSKGKGGAAAKQQGHMSKHKTDVCCKISLEATDNNVWRAIMPDAYGQQESLVSIIYISRAQAICDVCLASV